MGIQLNIGSEDLLNIFKEIDHILSGNDVITETLNSKDQLMRTFDWKLFSTRLLKRRDQLGFNIQDVDDLGGMDRAYYRAWETGDREPNVLATFAKVCVFLKADPRYFLGMTDVAESEGTSYPPTETKEAELIASIMDELHEDMRMQLLEFAKLESTVADRYKNVLSEQNKKIIGLLNGLIDESSGEPVKRDVLKPQEKLPALQKRAPSIVSKFDWSIFGSRLKSRREELGYTQIDIEENVGISRPYYANWENARKTPGVIEQFRKICILFEADPRYFLGITDTPNANEPGYINRKYPETTEIIKVVDELPETSREKILSVARIQQQAATDINAMLAAKNEKIVSLLKRLIAEVGGGNALSGDELTEIQYLIP